MAAVEIVAELEGAEEIGGGAAAFGFGCAAGRDGAEGEDDLGLFVLLDVAELGGGETFVLVEKLLGFGIAEPGEEFGEGDVVTATEARGGVTGEVVDEEGVGEVFLFGEGRGWVRRMARPGMRGELVIGPWWIGQGGDVVVMVEGEHGGSLPERMPCGMVFVWYTDYLCKFLCTLSLWCRLR